MRVSGKIQVIDIQGVVLGGLTVGSGQLVAIYAMHDYATPSRRRNSETGHARRPLTRIGRIGPVS